MTLSDAERTKTYYNKNKSDAEFRRRRSAIEKRSRAKAAARTVRVRAQLTAPDSSVNVTPARLLTFGEGMTSAHTQFLDIAGEVVADVRESRTHHAAAASTAHVDEEPSLEDEEMEPSLEDEHEPSLADEEFTGGDEEEDGEVTIHEAPQILLEPGRWIPPPKEGWGLGNADVKTVMVIENQHELAVRCSKELENILITKYRASKGKGLGHSMGSVKNKLPEGAEESLRKVTKMRNPLIHKVSVNRIHPNVAKFVAEFERSCFLLDPKRIVVVVYGTGAGDLEKLALRQQRDSFECELDTLEYDYRDLEDDYHDVRDELNDVRDELKEVCAERDEAFHYKRLYEELMAQNQNDDGRPRKKARYQSSSEEY